MNDYYIYVHLRRDTKEPFYIGKGRARRAYSTGASNRSGYWNNIYRKYGRDVFFLYKNLTNDEANKLEIETIRTYKKAFNLVNFTDGGEGRLSSKPSLETKKKMSDAKRYKYIGRNNPFAKKVKTPFGIFECLADAVRFSGIARTTLQNRIYRNIAGYEYI